LGAWDYGAYTAVTRAGDDTRLAAACVALKNELVFNGYGLNLVVETPVLGEAFTNRVKEFQRDKGLPEDGKIGARTALELFRRRVVGVETQYGLPPNSLGKQIKLESGFDPVAVGVVDPADTGIAQINLGIHTSVTKEQAFDPAFALDWSARYITSAYQNVIERANVIKAARAAYNVGNFYAYLWMLSGFATSGGPDLGGQDAFTRAANYIRLIDAQTF
jgi:hypothetical protein